MRARHSSWFNIRRNRTAYLPVVAIGALAALTAVCLYLAESTPAIPAESANTVATTISVAPDKYLATIPKQFVGFSMETADLCSFLRTQQTHPEVSAYLDNLQPLVLRVGGNSADKVTWDANTQGCGSWFSSRIGTTVIDSFFAYARKHGIQVIWTVNFKDNLPLSAAEEAAYVSKAGGPNLIGVAIGNEPNYYKHYAYAALASQWYEYFSSIRAVAPAVPIIGPDTAGLVGCALCKQAYFHPFVQQYAKNITSATMHYYPLSGRHATIASLLAAPTMSNFIKAIQASDLIKPGSTPLLIDEANSAYGGGRRGVSDTFASALWGLDYLYAAAESGIQGVYFHGSMGVNDGAYSPLGLTHNRVYAKPLYYAMLLFHATAQDSTAVQATVQSPINVTCHAVVSTDSKLLLTIINKDLVTGAAAHISLPNTYRTDTAIRLTAPTVNAKAGSITLGGSAVTPQGQWRPVTADRIPIDRGSLAVTVPPASAVTVTLYKQ